MVKTYDMIKM